MKRIMKRIIDVAGILIDSRPKCCNVSASETHEIYEYVIGASNKIEQLEAVKIEQLEAENKRLKEALEVYADESNWCESDRSCDKSVLYIAELRCVDDFNGWEIAQKALKE